MLQRYTSCCNVMQHVPTQHNALQRSAARLRRAHEREVEHGGERGAGHREDHRHGARGVGVARQEVEIDLTDGGHLMLLIEAAQCQLPGAARIGR